MALISATVAAAASIVSACFSYSSKITVAEMSRASKQSSSAFAAYREFGKFIISGDEGQRCRALLLITAIEPTTGVKLINEELAKQVKCDSQAKFAAGIKTSLGGHCRNARVTRTTLSALTPAQETAAKAICDSIDAVPETFEGPWPDGTVSFNSQREVDGKPVWCTCLPTK